MTAHAINQNSSIAPAPAPTAEWAGDGRLVVVLAGEVDSRAAVRLTLLLAQFRSARVDELVVEGTGVTTISKHALHVLAHEARLRASEGGQVLLEGLPLPMRRVVAAAGLLDSLVPEAA